MEDQDILGDLAALKIKTGRVTVQGDVFEALGSLALRGFRGDSLSSLLLWNQASYEQFLTFQDTVKRLGFSPWLIFVSAGRREVEDVLRQNSKTRLWA